MNGSSLGHPSFGGDPSVSLGGGMLTWLSDALLATVALPWTLTLRWLVWSSGLLMSVLATLGAVPAGYMPTSKLRELNSIVNHMHAREDVFRKAIRELQEELDAKDNKTKAAMRKLRSTKAEIAQLTEQLDNMQRQYAADVGAAAAAAGGYLARDGLDAPLAGGRGGGGEGGGGWVGSSSFWVLAAVGALVWSTYQFLAMDPPSLQVKIVLILVAPLLWYYINVFLFDTFSPQPKGRPVLFIGLCWALVGYTQGLVSGHCSRERLEGY